MFAPPDVQDAGKRRGLFVRNREKFGGSSTLVWVRGEGKTSSRLAAFSMEKGEGRKHRCTSLKGLKRGKG